MPQITNIAQINTVDAGNFAACIVGVPAWTVVCEVAWQRRRSRFQAVPD